MVRDAAGAQQRTAVDGGAAAGGVWTRRPHAAHRGLHPARRRRWSASVPKETYERPANLAWVKDIGFACALACDLRKAAAHRAYNAAFEDVNLHDLIGGIARALGVEERIHPVPFAELPEGASPYGPHPRRHAGYVIDRARQELGFEPSALEDALAETLAWYRVARPSHPGYADRANEIALARST